MNDAENIINEHRELVKVVNERFGGHCQPNRSPVDLLIHGADCRDAWCRYHVQLADVNDAVAMVLGGSKRVWESVPADQYKHTNMYPYGKAITVLEDAIARLRSCSAAISGISREPPYCSFCGRIPNEKSKGDQ